MYRLVVDPPIRAIDEVDGRTDKQPSRLMGGQRTDRSISERARWEADGSMDVLMR